MRIIPTNRSTQSIPASSAICAGPEEYESMGNVAVYVEIRAGKVIKASLEALSEGKRLADSLGGEAHAIAFGDADNIGDLGKFGAGTVHHITGDAAAKFSQDAFARGIADLTKEGFDAVLCAATSQGKELAPRVAACLDTGYAADVTAISAEGGKVSAKRPVFAGKAFAKLEIDGTFVATLRPNVFAASEHGAAGTVAAASPAMGEAKASVTELLKAENAKLDVAEADVIVSGGRGLKGPENWNMIEGLAEVLGAATGASRAVVDAGWRPHSEQVGQTGKTVAPKLYIAIGISGAIQHLAGMSSSKCIVAINKDPQAPIFKVADFGIVGDAFEVVPVLTEKLKALLG